MKGLYQNSWFCVTCFLFFCFFFTYKREETKLSLSLIIMRRLKTLLYLFIFHPNVDYSFFFY